MARYTLTSVKHVEEIDGTINDAIQAAIRHEEEYQPAYGVTISDESGEVVGEVRDGEVSHA